MPCVRLLLLGNKSLQTQLLKTTHTYSLTVPRGRECRCAWLGLPGPPQAALEVWPGLQFSSEVQSLFQLLQALGGTQLSKGGRTEAPRSCWLRARGRSGLLALATWPWLFHRTLPVCDFLPVSLGPDLWGCCGSVRPTRWSPRSLAPGALPSHPSPAAGMAPTGLGPHQAQPPSHSGLGTPSHLRISHHLGWHVSWKEYHVGKLNSAVSYNFCEQAHSLEDPDDFKPDNKQHNPDVSGEA